MHITLRALKRGRVDYFSCDNEYAAHVLEEALRAQGFDVSRI